VRPFTSSASGTERAARVPPVRVTRAETATRSTVPPETRRVVTPVTATFSARPSATFTNVSAVPSGRRASDAPSQPPRWKSETSSTSRRGRSLAETSWRAIRRAGA
jgi:hypothetical protein